MRGIGPCVAPCVAPYGIPCAVLSGALFDDGAYCAPPFGAPLFGAPRLRSEIERRIQIAFHNFARAFSQAPSTKTSRIDRLRSWERKKKREKKRKEKRETSSR